jgi:hypothetical protein
MLYFSPACDSGKSPNVVYIRVARFFLAQHTKMGRNIPNYHKIYQITSKYTKLPQNIPNYLKIYQITSKYTKLP